MFLAKGDTTVLKAKRVTLIGLLFAAAAWSQPDWQKHANWCANIDNGSSHRVYLNTCKVADQYDSVLACQRDAGKNSGDGGASVRAVQGAGRPAINAYMTNNKPNSCR